MTDDFFRNRLDQMIDLRHPLAVLFNRMPLQEIEASLALRWARQVKAGKKIEDLDLFGPVLAVAGDGGGISNAGRPRLPTRLMVAMLYLKQIISWRGKPQVSRCDNGPEYISSAIQNWASEWGIRLEYIQPGNPQQNAYVERFNRTVRYEWLSQYYWKDLAQVQDFATKWMWSYNHDRPNMALGGFTPKQRLAMAA